MVDSNPADLLESCDINKPVQVLHEQSRTFSWASYVLPKKDLDKLSSLYALCRVIDNYVDDTDNREDSSRDLQQLKKMVDAHILKYDSDPNTSRVRIHRDLCVRAKILNQLIDGVESDLGAVRIETKSELLDYCYRVAGTVGLMICDLYRLPDEAEPMAISLGIGMQLTNIARDVVEDFRMNRIYIPARWMNHQKIKTVIEDRKRGKTLHQSRLDLITEADKFYGVADAGWEYVPWSVKPALFGAARCYRSIGDVLNNRDSNNFNSKPTISRTRFILRMITAMVELPVVNFNRSEWVEDFPQTHQHLKRLRDEFLNEGEPPS